MPSRDAAVFGQAATYLDLGRQMKELEARRATLRDQLVATLDRRGATAIETEGLRITLVERPKVTYDVAALRATLSRRAFERVTVRTVDRPTLTAEVAAGRIAADDVEAATTTTPTTPYVVVTDTRGPVSPR